MSTKSEDLFMLLCSKAEATGSSEPAGCLLSPTKPLSHVSCKMHWVPTTPAGLISDGGRRWVLGVAFLPLRCCTEERNQMHSSQLHSHSEAFCSCCHSCFSFSGSISAPACISVQVPVLVPAFCQRNGQCQGPSVFLRSRGVWKGTSPPEFSYGSVGASQFWQEFLTLITSLMRELWSLAY